MQLVGSDGLSDFGVENTNELFGLPADSRGVGQHLLEECELGTSGRFSPIAVPDEVLARRNARLQGKSSLEEEGPDDGVLPPPQALSSEPSMQKMFTADDDDDDDDAAPFRTLEELIADAEVRKSFVGVARAASNPAQPLNSGNNHSTTLVSSATSSDEADQLRREILALRGTINALTDSLEGVCAMSQMQYSNSLSGGVAVKQPRVLDISAASLCTSVYPYAQQYQAAGTGLTSPDDQSQLEKIPPRNDVIRRGGGGGGDQQNLTTRHEHYAKELMSFYEAVFNVRSSAGEVRPSGAVTLEPSVPAGVDPLTHALNRQVMQEKLQNMELLLSKFHGFEEDLFRLLKAKYNTPLYRFEHF